MEVVSGLTLFGACPYSVVICPAFVVLKREVRTSAEPVRDTTTSLLKSIAAVVLRHG